MLHLGQSRVERGAHDSGWVFGTQFEPCPEPGAIIVWRLVGELDAKAPAIGEPDDQHRLGNPGVLNGGNRPAPQGGLEAPSQILPPLWLGEDVRVAAKRGHGPPFRPAHVAGLVPPGGARHHGDQLAGQAAPGAAGHSGFSGTVTGAAGWRHVAELFRHVREELRR